MTRELCRQVDETIHAHEMLLPGESVVVGCSGGPDSSCLLHILAAGLRSLRLRCTAVYIDHGLRTGTEAERQLVQAIAERVGADFEWESVGVGEHVRQHGGSKQAAARELRYAALSDVADRVGASKIAVGHTLSDQAETVLLQLVRGAGTRGISGIAPVWGRVVRPLLDVPREDTVRYCREVGLDTARDPSNQSRAYLRNRVRLELLPALREYNPAIEERLANLAAISGSEEAYLQAEAERALQTLNRHVSESGAEGLWLDVRALSELHVAIARRVVRMAASKLGARSLTFMHVERILAAARRTRGSEVLDHLPGLYVRREYERLLFLPADRAPRRAGEGVPLPIGGVARADWAKMTLQAEAVVEWDKGLDAGADRPNGDGGLREVDACREAIVDLDRVRPPLSVRPRRPGDRLAPLGLGGRKKLQDILTDAKVPRSARDQVAIVEDQEGIVWVVGHVLDERARVREDTKRALRLIAWSTAENGDLDR